MEARDPLATGLCLFNAMPSAEAEEQLLRCCHSSQWARRMLEARPFASLLSLYQTADEIWWSLTEADWDEAFRAHPRIGDVNALKQKYAANPKAWEGDEQKGASGASEEVIRGLHEGNRNYEAKFGRIFLVCATGKSAEEMLQLLNARMRNDPATELRVAVGEQAKITRLRLDKLLTSLAESRV